MSRVLPILFNTDMVRAILDGRKTVTRRVIKNPPHPDMPDNHNYCRMPLWMRIGKDDYDFRTLHYMDVMEQNSFKQIRYFESLAPFDKGDILYVRETWGKIGDIPHWQEYFRSNSHPVNPEEYIYKADNVKVSGILPEIKWRPSIHMPKEAARIWLKVMDVRVERLQDITNEQVLREGANKDTINHLIKQMPEKTEDFIRTSYLTEWSWIWDSAIKKSDFGCYRYDANPWVWVIEFERCEKPETYI